MKEQDNKEVFSNQNNKHSKEQYSFSVPNNWEIDPIEKLGKVQGGGTPSTATPENWNGDIPWLTPTEVTENREIEISETERYITEEGYDSSSTKLLPENSLLLTTRATIGNAQINKTPMCTNQGFQSIIPAKNVNTLFLYYQIKQSSDYLNSLGSGSTFNEISKSTLKNIKLPKPRKISEQRKIASVLYNVDQAIQKTEEIIEQTQRVKKGLMQDLFTEGYFEHDDFKEVRIGPMKYEIPQNWNKKAIGELAEVTSSKRVHQEDYVKNGIPFYRSKEIIEKSKGLEVSDPHHISEKQFEKFDRKYGSPEKGDLLITAVGTLGVPYLVQDETFYFKDGNLQWLKSPNIANEHYMRYFMNTFIFQNQIIQQTSGSSQKALTIGNLKKMEIFVPEEREQHEISAVMNSIDEKMKNNREQKHQLQRIKKGLMQDLLTGKVRTKDKDIKILEKVLEVEN